MASLSLREAAEQAGTSKSTIWRAIKSGRMSATRTDDGGFAIDPAELFRAFPPERPSERLAGQDATALASDAERPATPETASVTGRARPSSVLAFWAVSRSTVRSSLRAPRFSSTRACDGSLPCRRH